MSLLDVTRELHRTRAAHVRVVLLDFFGGTPPPGEVNEVVDLVGQLNDAFTRTAPEEPKKE